MFRRRFAQEVAAAQRVKSLYTAPVIDADTAGPMPWLATEHIPGPSLAVAVHESGPLPVETLYTLGAGVIEALQVIHRVDIVHRDLKPSNVLLAADGPRVIDFGVSRAADATPLTRTGGIIGSPHYMAPEQVHSGPITNAVDVFAFGCLLFFAATARSPFGEGPIHAVMYRIANDEPVLDGCPDEIRPLIERCLQKEPSDRPTPDTILNELTENRPTAPPEEWLPESVTTALQDYAAVPDSPARQPTPQPGPPDAATGHPTPPPGYSTPAPGQPTPPPGQGPPTAPAQPAGAAQGQTFGGAPPATYPAGGYGYPQPNPPAQRPAGTQKALMLTGGAVVAALLVLFFAVAVYVTREDGRSSAAPRNAPESVAPQTSAPVTPTPSSPLPSSPTPSSGSNTGSAGTTSSPNVPGAKQPGAFIDEYKGIDITDGYGIFFVDEPTRPKERAQDSDLYYDGYSMSGANKYSAIESGQSATYETCHANTKYDTYVQPDRGSQWCVYTDTDLLGIITVKEISDGFLTIDLKVFQGPADE